MILILSSQDDFSTNKVIDWLNFLGYSFLRISEDDEIKFLNVNYSTNNLDIKFLLKGTEYKVSDFKAFWYRRSHFKYFNYQIRNITELEKQINTHLRIETSEIYKLFKELIFRKSINKYDDIFLSKLSVLKQAQNIGIKIPKTIITTSKEELLDFFYKQNGKIISKNFSQGVFMTKDDKYFSAYTEQIGIKKINKLPKFFMPSLFQELIIKEFELRVFYLNGNFYSSAIFSQNDKKTAIDFRNYNFEKPNRVVPYQLPIEIEDKLTKLMNELRLSSGSLDLIINNSKEYVFLEVNPIGQYAQVSDPCNYYLDFKIATKLIELAHES